MDKTINLHPARELPLQVVGAAEWHTAHQALLEKEKAATRARDALAAERRRQPVMLVERTYAFTGPQGTMSLTDLFAGRRQLIVYHFMLAGATAKPCVGCSMVADGIGNLAHLHARDTSFVMVSLAPYAHIATVQTRLGWRLPWLSASADFNQDFDVHQDGFAVNVFLRNGSQLVRSYSTSGRGVETLGNVWSLLDITPLGRQEDWEDSPPGWPQTPTFTWWRHHDQYTT